MKRAAIGALFVSLLSPLISHAAGTFEVSGWIPYWRAATGTQDALSHATSFTSLMPFGYVVQNNGSLHDSFNLAEAGSSSTSTAATLLAGAKAAGIKVVPSVMWSNGSATHAILSSKMKRIALENAIAKAVKDNKFDGIDIDFEAKIYESRAYFSLFLQGLKMRLGNKLLYCAIEPRTPPSSYFDVIPEKLQYVNDYAVIGKYCDRVEIMAYDQGTTDLRLNAAASGRPYIPVSDPVWVKKVMTLASGFIPKSKLILGIPTYGYEYELSKLSVSGYRYKLQWALNPGYAVQLASDLRMTPTRNTAGELSFIYTPTSTPQLANAVPTPDHIVWWSDASAIGDKVNLAKSMGLRGVAIFKIDGGEDPGIWNVLPTR